MADRFNHSSRRPAGRVTVLLLACSQMAGALPVFQVDLQKAGSPPGLETQASWTAWDVAKVQTNSSVTTTVAGIGITITSNGGGWVSSRGGSADDRGGEITGTSWDDVVEDFAVARGGNNTATLDFTNLDSTQTYTLTVFNNESYTINQGFSGGTTTLAITTGTLVGEPDAGLITNVRPGARTDGNFDNASISFTPDAGGNASILVSSTSNFVLFNGLELTSSSFDTDGDGMSDEYELAHTDPASATALEPNLDDDSDGLTNLQEYLGQDATATGHGFGQTLASVADSDGDGLDDGDEVAGTLNPYHADHPPGDPPGGVPGAPTNPNDNDSDGDTILDGEEITAGADGLVTNPNAPEVPSVGLVISEVHYDPEPKTEFVEFIELHNTDATALDVGGWRFGEGVDFTFPPGTVIGAGEFVLIGEDAAALEAKYFPSPANVPQIFQYVGALDNDGETLELRNGTSTLVDRVDYRSEFPWPISPNGEGTSMQLINPGLDNDLAGSWRPAPPTPAAINAVFAVNAPPQIRQVAHQPQIPAGGAPSTVTVKVTDPDSVASVSLLYQIVAPGDFISAYLPLPHSTLTGAPSTPLTPNPDFENPANWTTLAMADDGTAGDTLVGDGIYTATIPGQAHRSLVRYRIVAEDFLAESVRVPYPDDTSLNFAYFVYDGVPAWNASQNSVHPEGTGHSYSADVLTALPIYTMLTRDADRAHAYAYSSTGHSGWQIPQGNLAARKAFNWECALVHDGVVYDHVTWRLRQRLDRYYGNGKRSMRFRFKRGHYFQAHDEDGNKLSVKWRTLSTHKMSRFDGTNTFGVDQFMNSKLWRMVGVECPLFYHVHFRMIDGADEAPDQYNGDFFGLALLFEDIDGRLLDARGLPDGNIYKIKDNTSNPLDLMENQARQAVTDGSDFTNIKSNLNKDRSDAWLRDHVDWDQWARYHAVLEAIRHYDNGISNFKNRGWYFKPEPGTPYGLLRLIPHDHDASWIVGYHDSGNSTGVAVGTDYPWAAIFGNKIRPPVGPEKTAFTREYRNIVREFRDLLWQEETVNAMIDEHTTLLAEFSLADRDRWTGGPVAAGTEDMVSLTSITEEMKSFAFVSDTMFGSTLPGGRGAYLDQITTDLAIPDTPTISYSGTSGFPVGALSFTSSAFADPQGGGSSAKIEWRIAEVSGPAPGEHIFEWDATWESGELMPIQNTISPPALATRPGRTYRARVRHADDTDRWSHWSEPLEFTASAPDISLYTDSLVISEIMYHPANPTPLELAAGFDDDDFFEYVEIRNIGTQALDLSDVRFTKGIDFDFSGSLAPGGYILVVNNLAAFQMRHGGSLPLAGAWSGKLDNGGERLKLSFGAGEPIRDFSYNDNPPWPTTPDGDGPSLVLIDPTSNPDHSDPANWRPSTTFGGNPGSSDAIPYPGGDLIAYAFSAPADLAFDDSGVPTYTYHQNIGADEVAVAVETSPNLIDWTPMDGSTVTTTHNGAGALSVTHDFSPPPGGARWFVRTTVTER